LKGSTRTDGTSTPQHLHLDFETASDLDLKKVGMYRYAEHESTRILMAAYGTGAGPDKIWVPAEGQVMPDDLFVFLNDLSVTVIAWNAPFERAIIAAKLSKEWANPRRFRCAMVNAMVIGLPGSLDKAGEALGLGAATAKSKDGTRLIRKFCKPRKATKRSQDPYWTHLTAPDDWALFKSYCLQDVVAERAVWDKMRLWRLPDVEQRLWVIDQEMNDRGVRIDVELVEAAKAMGDTHKATLLARSKVITGLDNPNSTAQLLEWLNREDDESEEDPLVVANLQKKTVEALLGSGALPADVEEVLTLRAQISKASLKKYDAILRMVCEDGYLRGTMQFYGASRTGRWAGRGLQVQNLPQGIIESLKLLALARELVRAGDYEAVSAMWDRDVSGVLSTLIRSCIIASPGRKLFSADFSAIEARVLAWLANCQWRLQVFRTHGKIYEASASQAFKIPMTTIDQYKKDSGKHHPIRKKGKVMELACGYQGHKNALIQMGAIDMGIPEEELEPMAEAWRDASPEIAGWKNADGYRENGLWQLLEEAAKATVKTTNRHEVLCGDNKCSKIVFRMAGGMLVVTLPSGRNLFYYKAHIAENAHGRRGIRYWGTHQKTRRWSLLDTYGGKLSENITQALSRDILREAIFGIEPLEGVFPTMLVHDEIVGETEGTIDGVLEVMGTPVSYCTGLPLKGAGYVNDFYYKD
jgi:DNA polymerase